MRGPDTDRLVLQERARIVAYARRERPNLAFGFHTGDHLPRMPLEPSSDEHACQLERSQAAAHLRTYGQPELASEIEAGKHVPDGE